jgi:MATE family multidrug resistance protein
VRIGQALGDMRPDAGKRTSRIALGIGAAYAALNAVFIISVRGVWGRVYSDDADVIASVGDYLPILALYSAFDGLQCVIGGTLRGIGRPGLAAGANVVAYIVLALPIAYALAIHRGIGLAGVWVGNCIGVACGFLILLAITSKLIRWEREAKVAHARALQHLDGNSSSAGAGAGAEPAAGSDDSESEHSDSGRPQVAGGATGTTVLSVREHESAAVSI